jgi:hypothetical protein
VERPHPALPTGGLIDCPPRHTAMQGKNLVYTAVLTHDGHSPKTFSLHLGETRSQLKKREVF